ncbi:MAG: signal peptidase I, partial [Solirubrobacterales bacterium]
MKLSIPKPQSRVGGLIELVVIVALALGLALAIQAWLVKPYQIPSESMEPTLDVGQRVLVNRFIYHFTDPAVGDIIVFHPPAGADEEAGGECASPPPRGAACDTPTETESGENFIKRLVAGPGRGAGGGEGRAVDPGAGGRGAEPGVGGGGGGVALQEGGGGG